jgi:hypothetical protein
MSDWLKIKWREKSLELERRKSFGPERVKSFKLGRRELKRYSSIILVTKPRTVGWKERVASEK